MLPQKYLDRVSGRFERLAVFKGSLALNICILYTKCLIKCLNVFLCQQSLKTEHSVNVFLCQVFDKMALNICNLYF